MSPILIKGVDRGADEEVVIKAGAGRRAGKCQISVSYRTDGCNKRYRRQESAHKLFDKGGMEGVEVRAARRSQVFGQGRGIPSSEWSGRGVLPGTTEKNGPREAAEGVCGSSPPASQNR